jgi:hypothetical protein
VLGETLLPPEVGNLHHHREMIQVLKAWITSERFPRLGLGGCISVTPLWTLLVFVTAVFAVVLAAVLAR